MQKMRAVYHKFTPAEAAARVLEGAVKGQATAQGGVVNCNASRRRVKTQLSLLVVQFEKKRRQFTQRRKDAKEDVKVLSGN